MKVVHLKKEDSQSDKTIEEINQLLEVIKTHPTNDKAYNRLMILYRKQRNYRQELKIINRAIKTFEAIFKKKQTVHSPKVKMLSATLSKAMGLADKKGHPIYQMGDLTKWKKRKALVEKKV